jgi:hypothetical protein
VRSNRFYRFCGLDLGKGVDIIFLCVCDVGAEEGEFFVDGFWSIFQGGGQGGKTLLIELM